MNQDKMTKRAVQIAEEHWLFVNGLLLALEVDEKDLPSLEYLYKEAMAHGYKHGIEDMEPVVINVDPNLVPIKKI